MRKLRFLGSLALCLGLGACKTKGAPEAPEAVQKGLTAKVSARLLARSQATLAGRVSLYELVGAVRVEVVLTEAPSGQHGVHIHEKGDCSAQDASSAGSHFNPDGKHHGMPQAERHLGDLGNLVVSPQGKGGLTLDVPGANLREGDPRSFLGRAIIIHAAKDDGTDPAGNSGARIGCAVLR